MPTELRGLGFEACTRGALTLDLAKLYALKPDTQLTLARDLALRGDHLEANGLLLTAFRKSGMDSNTLMSVKAALSSSSSPEEVVSWVSDPQAQQLLSETNREVHRRNWPASYKSLAEFLVHVEGHSPVAESYSRKFVEGLPEDSPPPTEVSSQ